MYEHDIHVQPPILSQLVVPLTLVPYMNMISKLPKIHEKRHIAS